MFAQKSGAQLERKAREMIRAERNIPVVCGHQLFSESNIVKRGASALLNARLISVIEDFLAAVRRVLQERGIHLPVVIVRSDGSLMTGKFTASRPVETLLCGPVASVMGAAELTQEQDCVVVDIGGTTTDIAFVKRGKPQRVKTGVRIGKWNTFVKGLFVDTFGLGGDSGIVLDDELKVQLEELKELYGETVMVSHLERLVREGILIRCGITPTDVMHVRGDFQQYETQASRYGMEIIARATRVTPEELASAIYDAFKKKLYRNIVRILIEDAYPKIRETGIGRQTELMVEDVYERAKNHENREFLNLTYQTPAVLVGVGAPTKLFLEDVGMLLGARVVTSRYSPVANALGAVVGEVSASAQMSVDYSKDKDTDTYMVFGHGTRMEMEDLDEAKHMADELRLS